MVGDGVDRIRRAMCDGRLGRRGSIWTDEGEIRW